MCVTVAVTCVPLRAELLGTPADECSAMTLRNVLFLWTLRRKAGTNQGMQPPRLQGIRKGKPILALQSSSFVAFFRSVPLNLGVASVTRVEFRFRGSRPESRDLPLYQLA